MQTGEDDASDSGPETDEHAVLLIKEVSFLENHPVEEDTFGNFEAPEWQRGRQPQRPVCYTRNTKVSLKATFQVTIRPSARETVNVRGQAAMGTAILVWSGTVDVSPSGEDVTTGAMESVADLPDHVAYFPSIDIEWEAEPPTEDWGGAGTSDHLFYLTLKDPEDTPAHWTLLHISCEAAHDATTEPELVEQSFQPFTTRQLNRQRDNQELAYHYPPDVDVDDRAVTTWQLLNRGDGVGDCEAWSWFLINMYKVHGVTSAERILVCRSLREVVENVENPVWFLVRNWWFAKQGSQLPPFIYLIPDECDELPGIAGQRNDNPPPWFLTHYIVRCFGKFYDPSYGEAPFLSNSAWEVTAIAGLFKVEWPESAPNPGPCAGFPKDENLAVRLLSYTISAAEEE